MPWKYVHKIAIYISKKHEVLIITDSNINDVNGVKIRSVNRLFAPLMGETDELLEVIQKENPNMCIMLLGLTSFLRKEFKINKPVIGIFSSPLYSINELIKNIGIKDTVKYWKYTLIHYLNALIPNFFVKKWESKFEKIIFLSTDSCKKFVDKGFPVEKAFFLPPGIDDEFLVYPEDDAINEVEKKINPEHLPIILYFTSPLTLRGTDVLVRAVGKVRKKMPCKLIFLSRVDNNELLMEEEILNTIAENKGIEDSVEIISKYLSPEQLKKYISTANIVCLPFKIVISDIPVSILEALALGKPVVSTNVGCIPSILKENGVIVNPNDPDDLADSFIRLLADDDLLNKIGIKSKKYMENYPNWIQIGEIFSVLIEN